MLPCPFHLFTGYECPFCGAQRMLLALLHGNIQEAYSYNPVLFCLLPFIILYIICGMTQRTRQSKIYRWCNSNKVIFSIIALFCVWGIVRNII